MNNQFKGWLGEKATAWGLSQALDPRLYRRVDDVIVPSSSFGTAQMDHIIVSQYGIMVIEVKNRNGLICGNPDDPNWQQISGGKVYAFQNPLRQNEGHIEALVRLTSLPRWAFHSVIYFCGDAKFTQPMPRNVRTCGITTWVLSKNKPILWPDETEHAWRRLWECKQNPNLSLRKHLQNISAGRRPSNRARHQTVKFCQT